MTTTTKQKSVRAYLSQAALLAKLHLRASWGILLSIGLIHSTLSSLLAFAGPPISAEGPNIPVILSMIVIDSALVFFISLIICRRSYELKRSLPLMPANAIVQTYAKDLLAEWLRVASGILIGFIMLIIPGLLRMWRWSFVAPIVCTDPNYHKGHLNALKHSENLASGVMRFLGGFWLFSLAGDFLLYHFESATPEALPQSFEWAWQIAVNLLSLVWLVAFVLVNYAIYESQVDKLKEPS